MDRWQIFLHSALKNDSGAAHAARRRAGIVKKQNPAKADGAWAARIMDAWCGGRIVAYSGGRMAAKAAAVRRGAHRACAHCAHHLGACGVDLAACRAPLFSSREQATICARAVLA